MKKNYLRIVMCLAILFGLCGCGNSNSSESQNNTSKPSPKPEVKKYDINK